MTDLVKPVREMEERNATLRATVEAKDDAFDEMTDRSETWMLRMRRAYLRESCGILRDKHDTAEAG